jgi:hypothetical protein
LRLDCFEVIHDRVELRAASHRREWMQATPNAFAYRCTPLTIANSHGWEMCCPFGFEAVWTGGDGRADVVVTLPDEAREARYHELAVSHFGSGILTFNPMVILRTEANYNLWLAGPANCIKDGLQSLSACIETDWMPFTFSMNWKFTRPNHPVRFEKGEPFCLFFPTERGVVARCEPRLRSLEADSEIHELYYRALARRALDTTMASETQQQFQNWYRRGELPNRTETNAEGHEAVLRPKPFRP